MRVLHMAVAALVVAAVGCSLILNGNDLHGTRSDGGQDGPAGCMAGSCPDLGGRDGGGLTLSFNHVTQNHNTTGVVEMAIGDVNQDGKADIVLTGSNANQIAILVGAGDGTFAALAPPLAACGANSPTGVSLADFNGDSKLDIVIGCTSSTTGQGGVGVLLNTTAAGGSPTFAAEVDISSFASRVGQVRTGDFDNDGKMDIVAKDADTPTAGSVTNAYLTVLFGMGNGAFPAGNIFHYPIYNDPNSTSSMYADDIVVGDFDKDGHANDVAAVMSTAGFVQIAVATLGARAGLFTPVRTLSSLQSNLGGSLVAADIDGDGAKNDDVIVINDAFFNPPYSITPLLNKYMTSNPRPTSDGGTVFAPTSSSYNTDPNPIVIGAGDFDRDGMVDVAVGCVNTGTTVTTLDVFLNTGAGRFGASNAQAPITGFFGNSIVVGDLNGDGLADIVFGEGPNGSTLHIFLNTSH